MSQQGLVTFNRYLTNEKTQHYLKEVLGSKKESFVTNCISLVSNNASLQNCSPNTIMYSAIKATSLGLPLDNNLGFAYVLPYKNKNGEEAQFQIGWKGMWQLAMRSGQFKNMNVSDVRQGEIVGNNRLTGEVEFKWISDKRDSVPVIGYLAYFELTNGFKKTLYMSNEELRAHGQKFSKSYNTQFSNWKNNFEAMASKTVLKQLLSKYAPLSIEMADAVKFDQAVIRDENTYDYIDNEPEILDPVVISEQKENDRIIEHIQGSKTMRELNQVADLPETEEQIKLFGEKAIEINGQK